MANQEIVPPSAFTRGRAERRKSVTSFSLPGFASNGTYSANFDITFSSYQNNHCEELQRGARMPGRDVPSARYDLPLGFTCCHYMISLCFERHFDTINCHSSIGF